MLRNLLWLALAVLTVQPAMASSDPIAQGMAANAQTTATTAITKATGAQSDINDNMIVTRSQILAQGNNPVNNTNGWRPNDGTPGTGTVPSIDCSTVRRTTLSGFGYCTTKLDSTGTTGALYKSVRIAFPETTCTGPIGLWAYSPAATNGVTVILEWSSDTPSSNPPTADATNMWSLPFVSDGWLPGAWTKLEVSGPTGKIFGPDYPAGISPTVVGSPTAGTIKQAEIIISYSSSVPAAQRIVWLDDLECGGKAKPMVVVGFDSGNNGSIGTILPIMDQYNFPGYTSSDGNVVASGIASTSIQQFRSRGWDVVSQGMNHTDYGANPAQLLIDWPLSVAQFQQYGLPLNNMINYPYGSRNATTDANAASLGIKCARSSGGNGYIPYNVTGTYSPLTLPPLDIDNQTTANFQAEVSEAEARGASILFYGHNVGGTTGSSTNTTLADFTADMAFLNAEQQAGRIEVVSESTLCRRLGAF